ncbi:MAG: hypothetical protein ACLVCW_09715 [Campylobacter sp.]
MDYLRLAEFRTSQNRGEIPRATKAHKSVAAISQASPSQKPIPRDEQRKQAVQGRQRTTDAIRRTNDARRAITKQAAHGKQCKLTNVRRATKHLLL